jgi:cysteine desulfurase
VPPDAIYLDHNATAPLLPEVRAAMTAAFGDAWANPSSIHAAGRNARSALETARAEVAILLNGSSEEIVFTSGGTEANHLAIRGLGRRDGSKPGDRPDPPAGVLSSRLEHPSVLGALQALQDEGRQLRWLPVGPQGQLRMDHLEAALGGDTALVTLALVNHELGNIYPISDLAARARNAGARFHTDAVQALGRVPVDVAALGVDALTVSAHKIGGPKGVGALWVRRGLALCPLITGGHQERERRAGTENVPGIVGFGEACRLVRRGLADQSRKLAALRDRLEHRLLAIAGARLHGETADRAPGVSNMAFRGASGQLVVIGLDLEGVAASTGAACSSGTLAPSPVLLALGLAPPEAGEAVRLSLGPHNTEEEIDRAAAIVERVVARVRAAA